MRQRRISLRELISQARMELQLEKMVQGKVKVTDEEVSRYYQSNRKKFRRPERMMISHIAVEKKEDAERIRQEIISGKITFADAARKYSIDPYGRENGGVFGWIARGNDPLQQAAFALKKDGDISPPVLGKKGWEIIRRDAYQSEEIPPFEEVQDNIRKMLTADRTKRLAEQMLRELMTAANIERVIDFKSVNQDVIAILQAGQQAGATGEGNK
ncbi:MAG: peptidyl-prolyl cis-trans isomerase, partial [Armatimonadetes bacterium]|nr:peptidyl-prolyl cis-trans isomerase [Armatimonadota bacterium]